MLRTVLFAAHWGHLSCGVCLITHSRDRLGREVGSHTLAELRALDAGSWFGPQFAGERIPTFAEVLERYHGRAHLHTEIKAQ
jgi:glycerophosphoryl diester phosphodiesterase